ncbi:aspartyl-phosphate phosphatase Spo0E family protein [Evansella sp. AB-P1]|uniref:aspartyl-phosphate phosphatase Spo0E family protein n=1 Tax=Evansella sp. AB-P1 TaxID=3037653 RepID=UPI00241CEACB|nr:aspartyl-phosphate phosphatase Spo0E family protein [Evansella sp. AB-P1]MDG5788071.1 aspartyl-phosphate phosphatase Spo0E family protein [Evansella sp. AB-P1]
MNKAISKKELLNEIEFARDKMHQLSCKMDRTSDEVVEVSTHLDQLLNEYQHMYYQKK